MKKTIISICVLMVLLAFLLYSCDSDFVYEDCFLSGNLYFSLHRFVDICRVEYGEWNGTDTSLEIEIPNEVDGHRVTMWGNDYPAPFIINMDRSTMICGKALLPEDAQIFPLYLSINIGDNLREIREIELKDFYQDRIDPQVYYQILVTIYCSPDNPHFYSENGKLYKKSTGTLIDKFYYESDSHN